MAVREAVLAYLAAQEVEAGEAVPPAALVLQDLVEQYLHLAVVGHLPLEALAAAVRGFVTPVAMPRVVPLIHTVVDMGGILRVVVVAKALILA